jgi:hypothetical protein
VAVLRIRKPRRHSLAADHIGAKFCFGPRLRISDEWHRRDLAGPVALLAMILENRQYIRIKGRRDEKYGKHSRV